MPVSLNDKFIVLFHCTVMVFYSALELRTNTIFKRYVFLYIKIMSIFRLIKAYFKTCPQTKHHICILIPPRVAQKITGSNFKLRSVVKSNFRLIRQTYFALRSKTVRYLNGPLLEVIYHLVCPPPSLPGECFDVVCTGSAAHTTDKQKLHLFCGACLERLFDVADGDHLAVRLWEIKKKNHVVKMTDS